METTGRNVAADPRPSSILGIRGISVVLHEGERSICSTRANRVTSQFRPFAPVIYEYRLVDCSHMGGPSCSEAE